MDNLVKFSETDFDTIYSVQSNMQGLVSVPKDLKNHIKVFVLFKDMAYYEQEKNNSINEMINVNRSVNIGDNDGICITAFVSSEILTTDSAFTYTNELNKLKELINIIYNNIRNNRNLEIKDFIKNVELVHSDIRFKNFIDFLCFQNPSRFHSNSYQEIMNIGVPEAKTINNNPSVSTNYDNSAVLVSPINNANVITSNNNEPVTETLSVGNAPVNNQYNGNISSGGGPSVTISNNKTLVKSMPNNAAFIKLPFVILILIISLVIGISVSVYLLK